MMGSAGQYWLFEKHPLCVKVAYSVAAVFRVLICFHSNTPVTACVNNIPYIYMYDEERKHRNKEFIISFTIKLYILANLYALLILQKFGSFISQIILLGS